MGDERYTPQKPTKPGQSSIPAPPRECQIMGCYSEARVVALEVSDEIGHREIANSSRFLQSDANGKTTLKLNPGLHYRQWHARCAEHMKGAQMSETERLLADESRRLGLTPQRETETLGDYMRRHNLGHLAPIAKSMGIKTETTADDADAKREQLLGTKNAEDTAGMAIYSRIPGEDDGL